MHGVANGLAGVGLVSSSAAVPVAVVGPPSAVDARAGTSVTSHGIRPAPLR